MQTPIPGTSTKVFAGGYDLSSFFKGAKLSGAAKTQDAATFGDSHERPWAIQRSGMVSLDGLYEGSEEAVDERLDAGLGVNDQIITIVSSDVLGGVARGLRAAGTAYDISGMVVDGIVQVSGALASNVGLERLLVSHPLGSEVAAGSGGVIDNGAASGYGLVAYLHAVEFVTAGGGGVYRVDIQDSENGSTWADLVSFTGIVEGVNEVFGQRVTQAGTIRRYLRWTTTNQFVNLTSASFQVAFGRGSAAFPYV